MDRRKHPRRRNRRDPDALPLQTRCDLRELRGRQEGPFGQENRAVDGIFELPQVARPVVAGQQRGGLSGQAPDPLALVRCKAAHEPMSPLGDRIALGPQGA